MLLDVFIIDQYLGKPKPQEGQEGGWFSLDQLQSIDFPEANKQIVSALNNRV